jgi:non-ribosomal peptide synthetase component F
LNNVEHDLPALKLGDNRRLLHGFFERSAQEHPEEIAIDVPPWGHSAVRQTFTYAQCDRLANALAETLRPNNDGEHIIAILLPREDERLYIAQLAVMKAGCAYVCLDPSFPTERLQFTIEDAQPIKLISDQTFSQRLVSAGAEPDRILDYGAWLETADIEALASQFQVPAIKPSSLAYVIYTSGTTGRPKGVMVEHQNVATLLEQNATYFDLGHDDRVIQNSSPAYDSSIEETYLAFAFGGTLVVGRDEVIRLGPDLGDWLAREEISVFCPPPTLLRTIGGLEVSRRLSALKLLYVGGEAIPSDVVKAWADGRRLENG